MTIGVVIAWRGRTEIAQALAANIGHFAASDVEVTVASCGGDHGWLARTLLDLGPDRSRVTMVGFDADHFNKSLALNLAVSTIEHARLLFLDADIVIGPETIPEMVEAFDDDSFVTVERVAESEPELGSPEVELQLAELAWSFEIVDSQGRRARVETNRLFPPSGERAAPGLILVNRSDFVAVGGMSSRLVGWGWEDIDLVTRLSLGLARTRRQAGAVTHLSHGDEKRMTAGRGKDQSEARNRNLALASYAAGDLVGTYESDLAAWAGQLRSYR